MPLIMPLKMKKPVNIEFTGLKVEPEGVEPSSKRATIPLSTCLVFVRIFV